MESEMYCEFREHSVHLLHGEHGLDAPVERDERGALTTGCMASLADTIRGFLHRTGRGTRLKVICAIPARGVSLRQIEIPVPKADELEGVLALQIEAQFPVPPAELAWGYLELPLSSSGALQSFLVAAVKKEILQPYATLFSQLPVAPVFTIAGLARLWTCPPNGTRCSILDMGPTRSELAIREEQGVAALKVISWGTQSGGPLPPLRSNGENGLAGRLLLSGMEQDLSRIAARFQEETGYPAEAMKGVAGPGRTTAILGLQARQGNGSASGLLTIRSGTEEQPRKSSGERKWAVAAIVLFLLLIGSRYFEPILQKPRLTQELAELRTYRSGLPQIERELSFLEFIKTNQPPYLDTIYLLADAAGRGLKVEALSIGRNGDLSLRGMVDNPDGANEFRSKLVDSGFFSRVVLEEQTPEQNHRQVKFRISAVIKPEGQRGPLPEPGSASEKPTGKSAPRGMPSPPPPLANR